MGVKYLTAYADSLVGDPAGVVRDVGALPHFRDADDGTASNAVVLDASGGLARYLKPDDSERNLFDFQEMVARVESDVAAFRALGYEVVPFLDATVPTAKLPVWKSRRRQEFGRLLKVARAVESPGPPAWPRDAFTPPESGLQALADAFAAAGCEVHVGLDDVDAEATAFCKASRAFAVVTCDSDFFVADLGAATVRLWHWEHLGPSWRGGGGGGGAPKLSAREYRVDRLHARLRLAQRDMPLLAACLGNDGVPHITRPQIERVLAGRPPAAAASSSSSFGGGGGRGGGGRVRGGRFGFGGGGFGGPPPWGAVEALAHEIARQLERGALQQAEAAGAIPSSSPEADVASGAHPDTARFVAQRVATHARTVREAYRPAPAKRPPGSFRPAGSGSAPNVVRAVVARHGMMVKAQRSDDVREPPVTTAVRELRMRAYAGCGIARVRELLYHPVAGGGGGAGARPLPPPPLVPPPAPRGEGEGPLGEMGSLLSALPAVGGGGGGSGGTAEVDESRLVWQEDFVDVDVKAELAALGRARAAAASGSGDGINNTAAAPPLPPLLPSSPEIVAASKSGEALVEFATQELLRLELITPVEAEILKRQASPQERAAVREQAGAVLLRRCGDRWSGNGGVICCMRSVRVATLLITVHTWVAVVLDNVGPTVESVLDVRVFNELWRREVARLEREEQPRGAAQRRRWVREGSPAAAAAASSSSFQLRQQQQFQVANRW